MVFTDILTENLLKFLDEDNNLCVRRQNTMTKVKQITTAIEEFAPPSLAADGDNVGLLVGDFEQTVERVLVCLDATSEAVAEAIEFGADLIVAHHPNFYKPLKRVVEQDVNGRIARTLIKNDISLFAAHTNFDYAPGGINTMLASSLELKNTRAFTDEENVDEHGKYIRYCALVSETEPTTLGEFVKFVQKKLNVVGLKWAGDPNLQVEKVVTAPGMGGGTLWAAHNLGAQVLVAGDINHHTAQLAIELGMGIIDAGHFETEAMFSGFMLEFLSEKFPTVEVKSVNARSFFREV